MWLTAVVETRLAYLLVLFSAGLAKGPITAPELLTRARTPWPRKTQETPMPGYLGFKLPGRDWLNGSFPGPLGWHFSGRQGAAPHPTPQSLFF